VDEGSGWIHFFGLRIENGEWRMADCKFFLKVWLEIYRLLTFFAVACTYDLVSFIIFSRKITG
jgi:hypothetical protein